MCDEVRTTMFIFLKRTNHCKDELYAAHCNEIEQALQESVQFLQTCSDLVQRDSPRQKRQKTGHL